ncbi:MAG: class I SAM-dependent methyltransferase, partial [Anaerolineales bacterium]
MLDSGSDAYGSSAAGYDSVIEPFARPIRLAGIGMLPPLAGKSVLDIGCGTGAQLKLYQEAGCRVYGVDLSPAMVQAARAKLGPGAGVQRGDACRIPIADQA